MHCPAKPEIREIDTSNYAGTAIRRGLSETVYRDKDGWYRLTPFAARLVTGRTPVAGWAASRTCGAAWRPGCRRSSGWWRRAAASPATTVSAWRWRSCATRTSTTTTTRDRRRRTAFRRRRSCRCRCCRRCLASSPTLSGDVESTTWTNPNE